MKKAQKILKIQKTAVIYLIIFIQCTLAITAGISAVYFFSGSRLPNGTKVGKVDIGGVDRKAAIDLINKYYVDFFEHEKLKISVKDGSSYNISYSDFDVKVDAQATVDSALETGLHSIEVALKKTFSTKDIVMEPVVSFNESKLKKILVGMSAETDKKPVDAALFYDSGKITKTPEQDGQKLNIANTLDMIRKHISSDASGVLVLSRYNNSGLETVQPKQRLRDIDGINTILSEYSTKLIYTGFTEAIKNASDAVNGVIIPAAKSENDTNSTFSLVEWFKKSNIGFENDNEGYDQVASTLYAALLSTGIGKNSITRFPHEIPVDYIEPGLDACISGNGGELKFSNTLSHMIAIFAYIEDNRIFIKIAGNTQDKKSDIGLKVDLVDRFPPPVFNIDDKNLNAGEKVVIDPGRDGIIVRVYRGTELISEDRYKAVSKVVQIGTGTDSSK